MVEILSASCPPMLWVIALVNAAFMVLFFTRYAKGKNMVMLLSGLITVGLFYDAMVLALGCFMEGGPVLLALSRLRYVLHGGLIPLIFALCAYALNGKGLVLKLVWGLTAVLSVLGIADGCVRMIGVEVAGNIVRYASTGLPEGLGWFDIVNSLLTFGTVIPLMIVGVVVWVRQKTPHLFLAGFLMFAFSGLGAACLELMFYISMYGEVLMALFFFLYAAKKEKTL